MTDTMPHRPERAATPAELAGEAARIQWALTGRQLPRTLHALCEQAGRLVPCECGARPGSPCVTAGGQPVYHVARFAAARNRGLLTMAEMDTVLDAAGDVFTPRTLVRDGTR